MDLWQLRVFSKVVELGSFSKAGKAIHLSQPTVSSHIKDLEEHFNCRLIDRLGKETVPTKAGELLNSYARKLLSLRDEAETAMADFHGEIKGKLTIGGSTIPGGYILPGVIGRFIEVYPEVTVSLIIGDTEKIIEDTVSGFMEFGIVGAVTGDKRVEQEKLLEDRMRLIVPRGHKWAEKRSIHLDQLQKEPFITRESGSGTLKSLIECLTRAGSGLEKFKVVAEMGNTAALCQGIKSRIGVSILSPVAVTEELEAGSLCALEIEGLDLQRSFHITCRRNRSLSPLSKTFMDFLRKDIGDAQNKANGSPLQRAI